MPLGRKWVIWFQGRGGDLMSRIDVSRACDPALALAFKRPAQRWCRPTFSLPRSGHWAELSSNILTIRDTLYSTSRLSAGHWCDAANGPVAQFHDAVGTLYDSVVVCSQDEGFTDLLATAVKQI
jgi:hypothetical protein